MTTFKDLNLSKPLWNALDDLQFTHPTPIQEKSFSSIMSGKDIIGIAQTGTGKTLAYLLPSLRQWNFSKKATPQIAILVPTRELVAQIVEEIEKLTTYMNVVTIGVYGGANIRTQAAEISTGSDIIVATPGRFLDLSLNGDLVLRDIKKLIIDEVDEMLDLGFRPQLTQILDILPPKRQNLLFSATLSEEIDEMIKEYFVSPLRVEATPPGTPVEKIRQEVTFVPNFYTKVACLKYLMKEHQDEWRKVLIFVDSRKKADLLAEILEQDNFDIGVIHSNKSQNLRFSTVENFKAGNLQFLIATDLISRGLDINEVTQVINLDVPEEAENYIHRIGRTGRAELEGHAITFVSPFEQNHWDAILEYAALRFSVKDMDFIEIAEKLLPEEQPANPQKIIQLKHESNSEKGAAFHEKKAKNKKVNVRKDWKKIKMDKYGKPKTRGQKRK